MATCEHCDRSLQAENFGEQNQLAILREWLCKTTCIKWYESYLDVPQDCTQYGVIDVEESEILATPSKDIRTFRQIFKDDTPTRSSRDVLKHINLMSFISNMEENNVYWLRESGTFIVNRVEQQDKNGDLCGHRHEMTIAVTICTQSSYPEDGELFHWCVFNCEGKPLCLPKPEC